MSNGRPPPPTAALRRQVLPYPTNYHPPPGLVIFLFIFIMAEAAAASGELPPSSRSPSVVTLTAKLEGVLQRLRAVEVSVEGMREELDTSRSAMNGIDALRAVARQEQYRMGRSLQACLRTRVLERLKACPPAATRGGRSGGRGAAVAERVAVKFEVDATRGALDELVQMLSLGYEPSTGRRSTRPTRKVCFTSPQDLLAACGVAPEVLLDVTIRSFVRRGNQSTPARVLIERHVDDEGTVWYVLSRDEAAETAEVAVRERETWSERRRAYAYPLKKETVAIGDVNGLPSRSPTTLVWRASAACGVAGVEGADAAGRVCLTLPACVIEELDDQLTALVCPAQPQ